MTQPLDITNLTNEDRDRLLLGMASAIMDLTGAINDLTAGIEMLLNIVTQGVPQNGASA